MLAAGPGSKCPPAAVKSGLAFADRVQVDTVHSGLEPARTDGDLHQLAGSLRALDEFGGAGDAFSLDVSMGGAAGGTLR